MGKIRLFVHIVRNMGLEYVIFRVFYVLRGKLGILKKQFPTNPPQVQYQTLEGWKNSEIKFFFNLLSKNNLILN
jgi:hypothetical protein